MAGNSFEFHPEAEREYLAALAWYQERSPFAAIRFESAFEQAINKIRENPHRWPLYLLGCRRYIVHQFPFLIVYSTLNSDTIVLAIAHGHRRPGYWKDRL
jgi:plasmid stabilization system protein ParE